MGRFVERTLPPLSACADGACPAGRPQELIAAAAGESGVATRTTGGPTGPEPEDRVINPSAEPNNSLLVSGCLSGPMVVSGSRCDVGASGRLGGRRGGAWRCGPLVVPGPARRRDPLQGRRGQLKRSRASADRPWSGSGDHCCGRRSGRQVRRRHRQQRGLGSSRPRDRATIRVHDQVLRAGPAGRLPARAVR